MNGARLIPSWDNFIESLRTRMEELAAEEGPGFRLPVGLFLVLDAHNGGDATAAELVRRLAFLDAESRNIVDFYYLGWKLPNVQSEEGTKQPVFDLSEFQACRETLHRAGVRKFGGYADLILVDAEYSADDVRLHFDQAMKLNLSKLVSERYISSLWEFLHAIIEVSDAARKGARDEAIVFQISDSLGLAFARESLLNFLLQKWGKIIGATSLRHLATQNLGQPRTLTELSAAK